MARAIKRIFILAYLLGLVACGGDSYEEAKILNVTNYNRGYVTMCIDGVQYIKTHGGMSAHFKRDGSLYACEEGP